MLDQEVRDENDVIIIVEDESHENVVNEPQGILERQKKEPELICLDC